jgi:metallo-beta-lactamase family protein
MLFRTVEYGRPIEILPGMRLTFHDAGHILGSASITLEVAEAEPGKWDKRLTTLAFTGDLGRKGAAVVQDPEVLGKADAIITESTYGGRRATAQCQRSEKSWQKLSERPHKRAACS